MLFYLNHTARVDIPPTFEPILYFSRFHNFCQLKSLFQDHLKFNEQGHRNGESARLQSLWPGFDCQTSVTCGLGLLLILVLALRVFLWVLQFSSLPPQIPTFKFHLDLETIDKKSHLMECPLLNFHLYI